MAEEHKTSTNPSGSVQQCDQHHIHAHHEWQNEFGGYFNVYCPGIPSVMHPAESKHFEEQAEPVTVDWDIDANRPFKIARRSGLERELADLINRHSEENESGTPDFILAGFLIGVLDAYNKTLGARAVWRGESVELPSTQALRKEVTQAERVFATILKLRDQGIIQMDDSIKQTDVYRTLSESETPEPLDATDIVPLEPGVTLLAPDALDGNDGKEVPLVIYTRGQRNEVGTARVEVTPGEVHVTGTITGVIPMFGENISAAYSLELDEPKDEPLPEGPQTAFQRYQQKGLSSS